MIVFLPQPRVGVTDGFFWDSGEQLPCRQGAVIQLLSPFPELSNGSNISFTCLAGMDEKGIFYTVLGEKKVKGGILVRWEVGRLLGESKPCFHRVANCGFGGPDVRSGFLQPHNPECGTAFSCCFKCGQTLCRGNFASAALGPKASSFFFSSLPTEGQREVDISTIYHVYTWLALQKGQCLCPVKVVATGHRFSINDHEVTAEHQ